MAILCPAGFSLWLAGLAWPIYLNFPGYRTPKPLSVCSPVCTVVTIHRGQSINTQRLNEWMDKCMKLSLPRGRTTKTHQRNPSTRVGSQKPLWKQQWQWLAHPEKVTGSKDRRHTAFKEKHGISCDFCTGNCELALNRWALPKKTPELGPYCQGWVFCQRYLNPFSVHVGAHPGSSLKRPSDEVMVRLGRQLGKVLGPERRGCRNHPKN